MRDFLIWRLCTTPGGVIKAARSPYGTWGRDFAIHRTLTQTFKTLVIRWQDKVEEVCITNTGD
jgi:hypothetical protein